MRTVVVVLSLFLAFQCAQAQKSSAPVLLSIDEKGFDALRAESKGKVLVLNVWATWCKPCVEEFADLVKLEKAYSKEGLDVVFVAIDDDARAKQKVMAFLRKMSAASPSYIKETDNDEVFINALNPQWSGVLPATFIYNRKGELVKMKVEESTFLEFEQLIKPLLQK
ncbi:MAG: TlpA disulfide reductase family protein [Bacteroidota bacterium]|jgi:thiol-disulfide isomerase/thioredoxin